MPALPPVPNVLKVVISGLVDAQNVDNWANVLHFRYSGSPLTGTDASSLATTINLNWGSFIASLCPSPTRLTFVGVTDLSSNTAGQGESLTQRPGTRGDDSIPANSAVLIRYPITLRYRGGHPRTYIYCGGNADLQGATNWSTLFTNEAQTAWRGFVNTIIGLSAGSATITDQVAVSYYQGTDPATGKPLRRAVPVVITLLHGQAVAEQQIANQRRRVGRGARAR